MADKIKLPPMPPHVRGRLASAGMLTDVITRDLEVARVVLEAAAKVCDAHGTMSVFAGPHFCASDIRALEFTHD